MLPTDKLIKEISEIVASGKGDGHLLSTLANDYAALCHETNQRLAQCGAMIEKGNEYQALQLAETEPNLMDIASALSFGGSAGWRDFCENNALTVPERLDAKHVRALNSLYVKGISANHQLYKDYRAAVTERKDDKALHIVRTIARLNPSDANGKLELERLLNKLFQAKLSELKAALVSGDESATVRLVDGIESLAPAAKLAQFKEYSGAMDVRWGYRKRLAFEELRAAATRLDDIKALGTWPEVSGMIDNVERLQMERSFVPTEEEQTLLSRMQRFRTEQHEIASRETRFREALGMLGEQIERVEGRIANRSLLTLRTVEVDYLTLNKRWQDVERFGKHVSEEMQTRVRRNAGILKSEIERLKKQRKILVAMVSAVSIAVAGVAAWFTYQAVQVNDYSTQLTNAEQAKQVGAADKLIASLQAEHKDLANSATLRSKIGETEAWTKEEHRKRDEMDRQVSELEVCAGKGFADADLVAIHTQLEIASDGVASLAEDLKSEPEARLSVVQNEFDALLASTRDANQKQVEGLLQNVESLAGNGLSFDKPVSETQDTINQIEPNLAKIETLSKSPIAELELPDALDARVEAVRNRIISFQKEIDRLTTIHQDMERATTVDAYRHDLEGYNDSQFVQSDSVIRARKLLSNFPNPDQFLMSMLSPNDPATWDALKTDNNPSFIPNDVFPAELSQLLALRDNDDLKDIWEVTCVDPQRIGETSTVYSRGRMKQNIADDTYSVLSGQFYDPRENPDVVTFAEGTVSCETSKLQESIKESSGSRALSQLYLNDLIDDSGSKYQEPILKVVEDLVAEKDANPLFKAYVMQQLQNFINIRPYSWGIQWTPTLREDFAALAKLCGDDRPRSSDWMVPHRNQLWGQKYATFFNSIATHSYFQEANVMRELITTVANTGLTYAGYIGDDGRPRIVPEAEGYELWTTASGGNGLICFKPKKSIDGFEVLENVAPFTPLFFVKVDRAQLLFEVTKKYNMPKLSAAALPPFFNISSN